MSKTTKAFFDSIGSVNGIGEIKTSDKSSFKLMFENSTGVIYFDTLEDYHVKGKIFKLVN